MGVLEDEGRRPGGKRPQQSNGAVLEAPTAKTRLELVDFARRGNVDVDDIGEQREKRLQLRRELVYGSSELGGGDVVRSVVH